MLMIPLWFERTPEADSSLRICGRLMPSSDNMIETGDVDAG